MPNILLIESATQTIDQISNAVAELNYKVTPLRSTAEALSRVEAIQPDLIITELQGPQISAEQLLRNINIPSPPVVVISSQPEFSVAQEILKLGAIDYLTKPVQHVQLLLAIKRVEERERLRSENSILRAQVDRRYNFANIIAHSKPMQAIFETVKKVADYKTTILITGESGTGKEMIAKAIHFNSARRNKPFIAINCGAIPENLLESELFGHKRGAFTDATKDKRGLFEEAEGGTILLDEIGELPLHLQVKLLRVLQESEIRPVGDSRVVPINVRIIAATLRDLEQDVLDGRFRDDLYYRLNVVSLHIPPLRERKSDIPILVEHFIARNKLRLKLNVESVNKEALQLLIDYDWPGNIRELENCIERAMILTEENAITADSLPPHIREGKRSGAASQFSFDNLSIKHQVRAIEESLIKKALEQTNGNRTHAAKLLEISHRTLLYKIKEYGLANDEVEEHQVD